MIQNGTMLQPVTTSCGYLPGTNLLQTLVKPNNMTLTQSYEEKRDLLIGQLYNLKSRTRNDT